MILRGVWWVFACLLFGASILSAEVPYSVLVEGVPAGKILREVNETSELVRLRSRPPNTMTALRHRAERDIAPLSDLLRGYGFYDVQVSFEIEQRSTTHLVRIVVKRGEAYLLSSYEVLPLSRHSNAEQLLDGAMVLPDPYLDLEAIKATDLGLKLNKPVISKELFKSKERLLRDLGERGYPLAQIVDEYFEADRSAKTMRVTLFVNSGPPLTFGPTTISGVEEVDLDFVRAKITWTEGHPFHPDKVASTRENLDRSRLFSSALITPASLPNGDNRLPMAIELQESKHRSIALGLSVTTDLGPGVSAEWENRNMRGRGERLKILGELESKLQRIRAAYRKPDFRRIDQDLIYSTSYQHQRADNFSEHSIDTTTTIERKISKKFRYSYGLSLKHIITSKSDNNKNRTLIASPLRARWSNANDPLDPSQGFTFLAQSTPHTAIPAANLTYVTNKVTASAYTPLVSDEHLVLAGKVTIGSIFGASRVNIPPPDRFYAGSESLLRGYQRLTVSPLDGKNKPRGGRSLAVANAELRVRATEELGWVAFYEMGNVWSDVVPQLGSTLLKSVGVGLRYHTPIGPVRLDFAVPLNKRAGIDESWEFYFNIGQAF